MSQQIQITGGAKVRNLEGVLTGTSGVVNALGINVPDGIPQLDGSGKILVSQLPNSVMEYKGTWDASTNTPTLADGTGNAGDVYVCSVAGTVNFGSGPITFYVGDQVLYSGTTWQRASGSSGSVTSVAVTESGDALTITGSPITTSGTINIGFAGNSGQYVNGAGGLTTFPSLTGFVPYTGATTDVDLGTHSLTAADLVINHTSGSGVAASITKGGNGEALTVVKTSGSGNAASITGGVTLLDELHLNTDLADAYIASAATWNAKQNAITLTTTGTSGAATFISNTLNVPNYTLAGLGGQPLATNLTSLSGLTFASTSFVKMTAAGTFALDTNTYALASALGDYLPLSGGTLTGTLNSNSKISTTYKTTFDSITISGGLSNTNPISFFNDSYTNDSTKYFAQFIGNWASAGTWGIGVRGANDNTIYLSVTSSGVLDVTSTSIIFKIGAYTAVTSGNISSYAITGTGLTGRLARFSDTSTIENSYITDTENTATLIQKNSSSITAAIFKAVPSTTTNASIINLDNAGAGSFYLGRQNSAGASDLIGSLGAYDGVIGNTGAQILHLVTSSLSRIAVFGNGNIGVGTTTDAGYKLDVNGTPIFRGNISFNTGTNAYFYYERPNNSIDSVNIYRTGGVNKWILGTRGNSNDNFHLYSYGTSNQPLEISYSTGNATFASAIQTTNLGIGVAANSTQLILGTMSTTNTIFELVNTNTSGYGGYIRAALGGTQYILRLVDQAANTRFTVFGDGTTQIGSAVSGGGALQVNGNVNINGVFQINGTTIGGGGGGGVTGSGTANYVTKWTGSSTLGNSSIQDNGTNITIVTTGEAVARFASTGDGTIIIGGNAAQGVSSGEQYITYQNGTTNTNAWMVGMDDGEDWRFAYGAQGEITDANSLIRLTQGGNFLIGTITDAGGAYKLQVNGSMSMAYASLFNFRGSSGAGDVLVDNSGSTLRVTGNLLVSGSVTATGGFFDTSDKRLKKLITDNYQAKGIETITPKLYIKNGKDELGYYAQDLQEILPSAVSEGSDGFLTLSYSQVHTAKIAYLEKEIAELKELIKSLIK